MAWSKCYNPAEFDMLLPNYSISEHLEKKFKDAGNFLAIANSVAIPNPPLQKNR